MERFFEEFHLATTYRDNKSSSLGCPAVAAAVDHSVRATYTCGICKQVIFVLGHFVSKMICCVFLVKTYPEYYVAPRDEQGVGVPNRPVGFSFTFRVCDAQGYVVPLY